MCCVRIYLSKFSLEIIAQKQSWLLNRRQSLIIIFINFRIRITIETVAILSEKAGNTIAELNAIPTTTHQFVTYFHYLDNCQDKIQKLFADIDFAKEYFDLMIEFDIFIDDSEKEVFNGRS